MAGQPQPGPASAEMVGYSFVRQYYTLLNNNPGSLHRFYKETSCLTHGIEKQPQTEVTVRGQRLIEEKIAALGLQDCKADISNIDCQESLNSGVMVMVLGTLINAGQGPRRFSQTFFLAVQPNGYFVLNDIFRYLVDNVPGEATANQLDTPEPPAGLANGIAPIAAHTMPGTPPPVDTYVPGEGAKTYDGAKAYLPGEGPNTYLPNEATAKELAPASPVVLQPVLPQPPSPVHVDVEDDDEPAEEPDAAEEEAQDEAEVELGLDVDDVVEVGAPGEPEAPPAAAADDDDDDEPSEPASKQPPTKPVPAKPTGPMSWASLTAKHCPTAPPPQPKPARQPDDGSAPADGEAVEDAASAAAAAAAAAASDAERVAPDGNQQCVVVKNIAMTVTEDDVRSKMEEFGPVQSVNCHFNTGGRTGYAFVLFASSDGARLSLNAPEANLKLDAYDCVLKVEEKRGRGTKGTNYTYKGKGRGEGGKGEGKGRGATTNGTSGKGAKSDPESNGPSGGRGGKGRGDGSYSAGRGEGKGAGKDSSKGRGGHGRGASKRSDAQ